MLQQQASDFQKTNRHIFGEEFAARPSSPSSRSFGRPWWCASTLAADWKNGATVTWLIPVLNVGNGCEWSIVTIRRKFRSQTSDNMDRWKAEQGRGREKRKIRRKKMQMREKVGKSRNTVFFQWFGAPEGRKVGSLKWRVRSHLAGWEMNNCTPLWREAHFEVKIFYYKTHHSRTTFGSWDVEKVHAVVARSTFASKMYKTHHVRTIFGGSDVEKVHAVVARSTFRSQNVQKHTILGPLLEVQMSFRVASARDCGPCQKWAKREGFVTFSTMTTTTPHYTPIHYTTTTTTPSLHSTTLHSTTTTLHSITLNYTTQNYITLHYTTLHYTTFHYTTLHYITLHYITLHYTTLPSTTTTLHYTTLHSTTLHFTTLQLQHHNYTPLH